MLDFELSAAALGRRRRAPGAPKSGRSRPRPVVPQFRAPVTVPVSTAPSSTSTLCTATMLTRIPGERFSLASPRTCTLRWRHDVRMPSGERDPRASTTSRVCEIGGDRCVGFFPNEVDRTLESYRPAGTSRIAPGWPASACSTTVASGTQLPRAVSLNDCYGVSASAAMSGRGGRSFRVPCLGPPAGLGVPADVDA